MGRSVALVMELIEPTIVAMGLELWGIEHIQRGKSPLLRIYIEREAGVTLDDCEKVSRQISTLLDVEDTVAGNYTLEVSSPGIERPLFNSEQFARFAGSKVKLQMKQPVEGRRRLRGNIVTVRGENIRVQVDDRELDLPHADIDKARIVY